MFDRDLVIVGGGPVGATLALGLREADFRVALFEARGPGEPPQRDRSLALSHGSRLILERLGLWSRLALAPNGLTPISAVEVSQQRGGALLRFSAEELGLPALGYVLRYGDLAAVLDQALAEQGVDLWWNCRVNSARATASYAWFEATRQGRAQDQSEVGSAALIVLADGGTPEGYWQHDYHQLAVVAEISVADAKHLAIERFTPRGPIALLPRGERHALVWTLPTPLAQEVLALDDQAFQARLRGQFGVSAERLAHPGPRRAFPLHLRLARRPVERRLLRLGNAAQTLHPVAGQGYNLGLRDAFELSRMLCEGGLAELGSERQLRAFQDRRGSDRWGTTLATHSLIELFEWRTPKAAELRDWGLELFAASPWLRRRASRVLMHGWR